MPYLVGSSGVEFFCCFTVFQVTVGQCHDHDISVSSCLHFTGAVERIKQPSFQQLWTAGYQTDLALFPGCFSLRQAIVNYSAAF